MLHGSASKMMAAHTATSVEHIKALFAGETEYATPKIDVRGAVRRVSCSKLFYIEDRCLW